MVDLTDITAIIGAVSGTVSLGLVIYKTIKDRPSLVFDVERTYFMQPNENDSFTTFLISMRVDNKGERSTTIHKAQLIFKYEGKSHQINIGYASATTISPDTSVLCDFMFNLPKTELRVKDRITNCSVIIKHTHDENTIQIDDILEDH